MAVDAEAQFHVLAVDDSLIDRKLIERLLKTSSYQVTIVDSGTKALEVLGFREDQTRPSAISSDQNEIEVNLVITDYYMPGMTGYDLLKKIKGSSSLRDIPVVIMSSENLPSRVNRCLEGGAEEFFIKPVQLSDMKRLKLHILKGKSREQVEEQQQAELEEDKVLDQEARTEICSENEKRRSSSSSKKRKSMDDEDQFPPERTRPRLTVI